jgi:methionyl aminopeptidase
MLSCANMAAPAVDQVCITSGCSKAASLQCPTCLKMNIQGSFFCSQVSKKKKDRCVRFPYNFLLYHTCEGLLQGILERPQDRAQEVISCKAIKFQLQPLAWISFHRQTQTLSTGKKQSLSLQFTDWAWFFSQTPKREVPSHIPRPDYAESGIAESERVAKRSSLIKQLTPEEIEGMRKACRVSKEISS